MNKTETLERTEDTLLPESDLVPLALIAIEVGETVDRIAHGFAESVVLDDVGMRAIPAAEAREFFTERAERKARQVERQRRRAEEAAKNKVVPRGVPGQEGMTPAEAMVSQDPAFSTPADDFGPGHGSPTTELLEDELAKGRQKTAEKRRLAAERRKEREAKEEDDLR